MDNFLRFQSNTVVNGVAGEYSSLTELGTVKSQRNFKLLTDPSLMKGVVKLYRYDGVVPSDPSYPPVIPRDPRNPVVRIRARPLEPLILPVPRLKIDQYYVGEPPAVEITITNLNDNIDKQFLAGMLDKCGVYDEVNIYHHPTNNKHLGIARIVFENVKGARVCVEKYNQKSVMGKILTVFYDPFGNICKQSVGNLTSTKSKQPVPAIALNNLGSTIGSAPSIPPTNIVSHVSSVEFRHEYVSQESFEHSAVPYHSHRSEREYSDRYLSHFGDIMLCFIGSNRKSRDSRDPERTRDKYSSVYEKERSKHHHYHRKRERSRDRKYEVNKEISSRRDRDRERDYDRCREKERRNHSISSKDQDYRVRLRDQERSNEKERVKDRGSDKYSSRYSKPSTRDSNFCEGTGTSNPSVISATSHYTHVGSAHHATGAGLAFSNSSVSVYDYHSWSGHRNWAISQCQPPPPPLPPDTTPDWDDEPEHLSAPPISSKTGIESMKINKISPKVSTKKEEKNELSVIGNVDLDTRIAMMFKGKSFGNAPPFLQMESSESDSEKAGPKEEDGEVRSDTNGKFKFGTKISPKIKRSKHISNTDCSMLRQQGTSDISSSDDELLLKKESYSPIFSGHLKNDDDRMSLSSLSSHEGQRINEKAAMQPSKPSSISEHKLNPTHMQDHPATYPTYTIHGQIDSSGVQNFPNPAYMQSTYLPGFGGLGFESSVIRNDSYNTYNGQRLGTIDSYKDFSSYSDFQNDPYIKPIEEVVVRVSDELKQILKRDFNKRMIQSTAYKKFETWWDEQSQKNRLKDRGNTKTTDKVLSVTTNMTNVIPTVARADTHLLSSSRDISDYNSYSALGLRASIPKLPSFRRIQKRVSPKHEQDLDKHLSDQEEMVHGSDSDGEEIISVSIPAQIRSIETKVLKEQRSTDKIKSCGGIVNINRKISISSVSSSSSDNDDDQSSDDDTGASYDDLSSISDEEIKTNNSKHHKRIKQNIKELYSDSDDNKNNFISKNSKLNIYSDSDDEQDSNAKQQTNYSNKSNRVCLSSINSDLEDISKDSTFSIGDDTNKELNIDESSNVAQKEVGTTEKCESSSVVIDTKREKANTEALIKGVDNKKTIFEYDRIYSDSEEERDYQERRRRNTEYMAQIEQEFIEEQKRKISEALEENKNEVENSEQTTQNLLSPVTIPSISDVSNIINVNNSVSNQKSDSFCPSSCKKDKVSKVKKEKMVSAIVAKHNSEHKTKRDLKKKKEPIMSVITSKSEMQNEMFAMEQSFSNGYIKKNNLNKETTSMLQLEPLEKRNNINMSPTSSDGGSSQASQVALEHCYSLPPKADITSVTSKQLNSNNTVALNGESAKLQHRQHLAHDHGSYTSTPTLQASNAEVFSLNNQYSESISIPSSKPGPGRPRKDSLRVKRKMEFISRQEKSNSKSVTNMNANYDIISQELKNFVPIEMFSPRESAAEMLLLYEFLTKGIDAEDIQYMRLSYEKHLQNDDVYGFLLNNTHWVDHCVTDRALIPPPNKKKKKEDELKRHKTGCARTEGFYKLDVREKAKHKYHHAKANAENSLALDGIDDPSVPSHNKLVSKMQGISREARSNQRRLLTAFGSIGESELLKFNQLKFRKKQLKFAKSSIHDWGLFAMEPIAADEMVIEYVGQMIRPVVADLRETKYEAIGIYK